jgi:hypothetical protein
MCEELREAKFWARGEVMRESVREICARSQRQSARDFGRERLRELKAKLCARLN